MATIEQHVPKIKEKISGFTSGANTFLKILGSTAGLDLDFKQNEKDDAFSKAIAPLAGIAGGIATQGLSSMFTKTPPKAKYGMGFRNNLVNKPSPKDKTYYGNTHDDVGGGIFVDEQGKEVPKENAFAEVEGGGKDKKGNYLPGEELITTKSGTAFILSNSSELIDPETGDTFAQGYRGKKKKLSKYKNSLYKNDPLTKNSIELSEEKLKQEFIKRNEKQKELKGKGIQTKDNLVYANDGVLLNLFLPRNTKVGGNSLKENKALGVQGFGQDTIGKPTVDFKDVNVTEEEEITPDPYTRSFLPQAIGYGVQALANLPGLFTKPETVKYDRVTPETVDLTAQRTSIDRDRDLQIALARRAGGNSNNMAQTMNFLAGANQGIFRETGARKGESFMNQENINAEIRNKAGMFNAELSQREADANSAERDAARGIKMQSLSNIGTIAALTGKSYDALQNDIEMIQSWGRTGDFGISNKGIGRNPDGTIFKFGGRIGKSKKC